MFYKRKPDDIECRRPMTMRHSQGSESYLGTTESYRNRTAEEEEQFEPRRPIRNRSWYRKDLSLLATISSS